MNINEVKNVYFIGIGGIGMSALARYFAHIGATVAGYDRTPSTLTAALAAEGMAIHYTDDIQLLMPQADLVVYTPAIPATHSQLQYYRQQAYTVLKRSEVLQLITQQCFTIAVAGSHGKTSVTSLITHLLHHSGYGCTAFVGGIMTNYNANFVVSNPSVVVIEADEFDRSFLRLQPNIAVITAVDSDHLDIYGTQAGVEEAFLQFAAQLNPRNGQLFINQRVTILPQLAAAQYPLQTYDLNSNTANFRVTAMHLQADHCTFDVQTPSSVLGQLHLPIGGKHNIENALAAIAVAQHLGIDDQRIAAALATFMGIKRRFEYIVRTPNLVFIDDYAHHPEEINALLQSVLYLYPQRKVSVIFQPHLYSRTRDLAAEFGQALSQAHQVILLDIYPARELPIEGVTSALIFKHIEALQKSSCTKTKLLQHLKDQQFEVLLTVGAGDVGTYIPQIKALLQPATSV